MAFSKGDWVKWRWGNGEGKGEVREVFHQRVERQIKGSTIVRNADKDDPAYLVVQDDGDEVLKKDGELQRA